MNFFSGFFKGLIIGIGNIAPGVSGGALAMILGIYEKLVYTVGNFFKDIKKNIIFLFPIGVGAGVGIVGFSWILKYLLEHHPMPTTFTFAGLIIGTLPVLFKRANKKGFKKVYFIPFIITLAIAISFVLLETGFEKVDMTAELEMNIINILKLALCGFLIAGSIVIPGVSGSVLMMLIGVYDALLEAISTINIVVLFPMAVGLGIGVLAFSKLMEYLLDKHYSITYYAVLGFVIGAIPEVITGFSFNLLGALSILCFAVGLVVSYRFSMLEKD